MLNKLGVFVGVIVAVMAIQSVCLAGSAGQLGPDHRKSESAGFVMGSGGVSFSQVGSGDREKAGWGGANAFVGLTGNPERKDGGVASFASAFANPERSEGKGVASFVSHANPEVNEGGKWASFVSYANPEKNEGRGGAYFLGSYHDNDKENGLGYSAS